jgi:hypothetical protein
MQVPFHGIGIRVIGAVFFSIKKHVSMLKKEDDPWIARLFQMGYADDMVRVKTIDPTKTITTKEPTLYGFDYKKKIQAMAGYKSIGGIGHCR